MTLKGKTSGFTLVELMVTVAIVALLSTISISSYRRYLMRTNRTEATAALLQIQVGQEKFYLQNNSYASNANITTAAPTGLGLVSVTTLPGGYYTLAITSTNLANGYTVTATPVSGKGQAQDAECTVFSVDQTGRKTALGGSTDTTAKCWK